MVGIWGVQMRPNTFNPPHLGEFRLQLREDAKNKLSALVLNVLLYVIAHPTYGEGATEIIKIGRDHQYKHHPQRYQSKHCLRQIYSHISRLLVSKVLQVLLDALIAHVFQGVSLDTRLYTIFQSQRLIACK